MESYVLLVVVLINRLYNGRYVRLVIGGNHTWHATLKSKLGFKVRVLEIPSSVHGKWSDLEIRILGQYLNPRDKKTILETNEDDASEAPGPHETTTEAEEAVMTTVERRVKRRMKTMVFSLEMCGNARARRR